MNEILQLKLQLQHQELAALVSPLSRNFVGRRHRADKWSIHENLAHLGRYQEVFHERLLHMLGTERPVLGRYRAEDDPAFPSWVDKTTAEVMDDLNSSRAMLGRRILDLSPEELGRAGRHPVFGLMSIAEWVHFFVLHESHHIYTIFRMIHQYGTP